MTVRLPAVEEVLGARIDAVTAVELTGAVTRRVQEMPDLDFKRTIYGDLEELAKDVTAMANASGGLIILGIGENNGTASSADLVEISDNEERRMRQSLRSKVVPFIPNVVIKPVVAQAPSGSRAARGFYLIAVERSLLAPHGVMSVGDEKRKTYWPMRDGTTTRYLSEHELSDFYRRRFSGENDRRKQLKRVVEDGLKHINTMRQAWLIVASAPALSGRLPSGIEGLEAGRHIFGAWARATWSESYFVQHFTQQVARFIPGVRRTIVSSDQPYTGNSSFGHAEIYSSGAMFAALAIGVGAESPNNLWQQRMEGELFTMLSLAGWHARETRAAGEALVQVGLHYPFPQSELWLTQVNARMSGRESVIPGTLPLKGNFYAEPMTVGVDELANPEGVARVSYELALDLAAAFGSPDCRVFRKGGRMARNVAIPQFGTWAQQAGLEEDPE